VRRLEAEHVAEGAQLAGQRGTCLREFDDFGVGLQEVAQQAAGGGAGVAAGVVVQQVVQPGEFGGQAGVRGHNLREVGGEMAAFPLWGGFGAGGARPGGAVGAGAEFLHEGENAVAEALDAQEQESEEPVRHQLVLGADGRDQEGEEVAEWFG